MIVKVSAIKNSNNKTYKIDFIIDIENEELIRSLLWSLNILLLSMEPFRGPTNTFWTTFLTIKTPSSNLYNIITNEDDLSKAIETYLELWFDITRINNAKNIITNEYMDKILYEWKKNLTNKKIINTEKSKEIIEEQKKQFTSKQEKELINVVQTVIEDIELIKSNNLKDQDISQEKISTLNEIEANLRKLKMWSNINTLLETLESTFKILDQIELQHITQLRTSQVAIIMGSHITNIDVQEEVDHFKKAEIVKQAWTSRSPVDNFYIILGKFWIYEKLLSKDIFNKLKNISWIINNIIDILKIILLSLLILIWIYIVIQEFLKNTIELSLRITLIKLWSISLIISLIFARTSTNIILLLLQITISTLLYRILTNSIILNFAL